MARLPKAPEVPIDRKVTLFTASGDAVHCRQVSYLGHPFCYPEASQIGAAVAAGWKWDHVLKPIVETLLPETDPVIVEVGSNIGASILEVLDVRPQARIVCYEPSDRYRVALEHNLVSAGHGDVDIRARIVGQATGTGYIHTDDTSGRSSHMEHLTRSQAAPVVRLDDELADRTEPVQLLKVDTDGYDIDVLRSAEGILMRDQPVLFVEFCPVLMDTDPIADLTWLQGLGYEKLVCLDNLGHHVGTTDDPAQAAAWAAANTYCDILTVATGSAFESKLADVALPRRRRGVVWAARSLFPRRVRPTNADDAEDAEDAAGLAAAFQAQCLARVDLSRHNAADARPTFPNLQSQAASAAQCDTPEYLALAHQLMGWEGDLAGIRYNRKVWEYAYIVQAVAEAGLLRKGAQAVGFGVGSEPIPAYFALHGMDVLATDQGLAGATKEQWTQAGQLLQDLSSLSRPHLLSDDDLAQRVRTRDVDMNGVPDDIGRFDVVWSSCVIEHLGSPERGLDFVLESCGLLNPGGIAVHTTELELTDQPKTQDYGHCAVYRVEDLAALEQRLAEIGCSATFNFDVSMDTFEDRWISLVLHPKHGPHLPDPDGLHLKLLLGESVSTSFGILIRKL